MGRLLFNVAAPARLLGPADFGIVAAGMVYVAFAMLVLDQGFGAALVQRRDVDGGDVRSVATLNVILAFVLTVVTIVVAPAAADFFKTPQPTAVLRVLAYSASSSGALPLSRRCSPVGRSCSESWPW